MYLSYYIIIVFCRLIYMMFRPSSVIARAAKNKRKVWSELKIVKSNFALSYCRKKTEMLKVEEVILTFSDKYEKSSPQFVLCAQEDAAI